MASNRLDPARVDWLFIFVICGIVGIGAFYLASASPSNFLGQMRWIGFGIALMLITIWIGYNTLVDCAWIIYAITFGLLLLVLALPPIRGAHGWIQLPGFNVQPSEMAKVAVILMLARFLRHRKDQFTLGGLVIPVMLAMVPTALLLKQPDLGGAIMLPPVLLAILFASGARKTHLLTSIALGVAASIPMWMFIMKDYQKNRILAFLSPERYEAQEAYQLIMSTISIGSGGLTGLGWKQGTCNSLGLLPDRHTDFIFGVIAEEGGLMRAGLLLLLFLLLALCGLARAVSTREPGGRLVAVGCSVLLGFQAAVNIGVVQAVLPTTGITLPLVSYGGSSMLMSFVQLGLLISVSLDRSTILHDETFRGKADRMVGRIVDT